MQNYKYFIFSFLIIIFGVGFSFLNVLSAQAETVLKYPIPELDNCQNKNACKQYCSVSSHYLACTNFGEKNNLISKEDAVRAKKFVDVLKSEGPGGCKGETACKNHCNKTENQKECFSFSMKNGLISTEKLKEMKDGLDKLRAGLKQTPPEMKNCIIEKVGAPLVNKIEIGQGEAIDLVEIGGAAQSCAISFRDALLQQGESGLKQAPPEVQGCVKSIISNIGGKIKGGGSIGQSDIISVILQSCLPKGTKIPSGALPGGGMNKEFLKKMEQYYGKNLSPKDLESLKKVQEQYKNIIPPGTEIPPSKESLNLEDIQKIQEKIQENQKNIPPEDLELYNKMQEQGQFENVEPPEIPGDSSGMGM